MKRLTARAALLITVSCCCFAMVLPGQAYAQAEGTPADMPLQGKNFRGTVIVE